MHKSKGNILWFDDVIKKTCADPIRLLYCLQDPSQELKFGFNVIKEPKNNLNILYNINRLVENSEESKEIKIEDKWILSKLNSLIEYSTKELENLHPHLETRALKNFWLNDLSRGYIRIIRERLLSNDAAAKSVLKNVYLNLIKLCAPTIPFTTEKIWQDLRNKKIVEKESIHLSSWPKPDKKKIDKKLEKKFDIVFNIIEKGLAERDKVKIGLRWPLINVIISGTTGLEKKFKEIIKNQLNVRKVSFKKTSLKEDIKVELNTKITPELEAEGYARELSRQVQSFRKKLGLEKRNSVELFISTDNELKKILEKQKEFIKERTNSKKLEISENVAIDKERFKNRTDFKIKNKRGNIRLITTKK